MSKLINAFTFLKWWWQGHCHNCGGELELIPGSGEATTGYRCRECRSVYLYRKEE